MKVHKLSCEIIILKKNMDYLAIYKNIISRAKQRVQPKGYFEKHHIIPRCMGGSNKKDNIAALTAREHFICHKLLCEIYPDNHKLKNAIWIMINGASSQTQERSYRISSKEYERLKIEYSQSKKALNLSSWNKGIPRSEDTKQKISKSAKLRQRTNHSEDTKRKIADGISNYIKEHGHWSKGKPAWNSGKNISEEMRLKIQAGSSKAPKESITCPHCNKVGGKPVMKRFHFDKCKDRALV